MTYFSMFPVADYEGRTCVDISRRIVVRRTITSDPRAYRPYDVPAGTRADQLADGYYGSVDREWMVLISADVLDPYYDWYLSDKDFASQLIDKYGSLEETVERIHHWQVNWYGTDQEISPQDYGTLPDQLKPYYEPVFAAGSTILSYERRADDVETTTNMIVTVGLGQDHGIPPGARVQALNGLQLEGQAEVSWANSTHAKLVHVLTSAEPGLTLRTPAGDTAVILTREYTANNIPVDQRPFWEPVTVFEWERDKNESSKSVRLIDARFADQVETEFQRILKE